MNTNSRTFQVENKNTDVIKEYVYKKHAVILAKDYSNLTGMKNDSRSNYSGAGCYELKSNGFLKIHF